MKKLNVPLILQEKDSVDCGPTCVQMVLKYFEIDRSIKELKSKLYYNQVGTSVYDNGTLLLLEKLNVTAITAQPLLFPPDKQETLKTDGDILNLVQEHISKKNKFFEILKTMEKYLKNNGKIKVEIPTFDHIVQAVNSNSPVIALMNAQALGSNEGEWHFVVICGYNEKQVFINNPWLPSKHQGWFPIDRFFYGLHASTLVDIDNGTLLVVSKN